jgi:hypothetical protein
VEISYVEVVHQKNYIRIYFPTRTLPILPLAVIPTATAIAIAIAIAIVIAVAIAISGVIAVAGAIAVAVAIAGAIAIAIAIFRTGFLTRYLPRYRFT